MAERIHVVSTVLGPNQDEHRFTCLHKVEAEEGVALSQIVCLNFLHRLVFNNDPDQNGQFKGWQGFHVWRKLKHGSWEHGVGSGCSAGRFCQYSKRDKGLKKITSSGDPPRNKPYDIDLHLK